MTQKSIYKKFVSELIRKQMVILGPAIALDCAREVPGLRVDNSGDVLDINGDTRLVLQDLADNYFELSQPVSVAVLESLFRSYPAIRDEYNRPLPDTNFSCAFLPRRTEEAG